MTDRTVPLPPGLTEADLNAPTSMLTDCGDVLTLYVGAHELGGVFRRDAGIWQLWYPIGPEDFAAATRRWLVANGLMSKARRAVAENYPLPAETH